MMHGQKNVKLGLYSFTYVFCQSELMLFIFNIGVLLCITTA